MPSLPLDVHQVLEEEYVSMYGPLERLPNGAAYTTAQILDCARVRELLRGCKRDLAMTADDSAVLKELNTLVTTGPVRALITSPAMTEHGRGLIRDFDRLMVLATEQDAQWGELELRRAVVDEALNGTVKPLREVRLDHVYQTLHGRANDDKPRTALCVSGGGIRSATFALGVIQGLASANILTKFDYLSTVSGGGYIGSWLSSWVRRHPKGVEGVQADLGRTDTAVAWRASGEKWAQQTRRQIPEANIDPEAAPVRHLREYSNYMSPRLGLLSGDSWTIVSQYLRNLLLNLLVLVPLLAAALALPRLFSYGLTKNYGWAATWHPWVAAIFSTIAFAYIGAARPLGRGTGHRRWKKLSSNTGYFVGVVLPLVVASCALALFWARAADDSSLLAERYTFWPAIAACVGMVLVPWAVYYGRSWYRDAALRRSDFANARGEKVSVLLKMLLELFAVGVALVASAVLFWLVAKKVFPYPLQPTPELAKLVPYARLGHTALPQAQLYICFAVPLALMIFFVQASIFVGLSSRGNEDADREWWGRGGALLIMVSVGLALFSFIAVFGPVALYAAPTLLASIGGAAGVGGALLGFSAKTPANQKEKEEVGLLGKAGNLASALIVPLFVVFILAAISLGSTWLIQQISDTGIEAGQWEKYTAMQSHYSETSREMAGNKAIEVRTTMPAMPRATLTELRSMAHLLTVENTDGWQLLGFAAAMLLALLLSLSIGVNKFSMHALYRNRLIRAYLGASRRRRQPDVFTGFDEEDNLQMWELRPEMLWTTSFDERFVDELRHPTGSPDRMRLSAHLWSSLPPKTQAQLIKSVDTGMATLAKNLNGLLLTQEIAKETRIPAPTWLPTNATTHFSYSRAFCNRALLDDYYQDLIEPMVCPDDVRSKRGKYTKLQRAPLHIVNAALNLTTGDNLGWQQRMAESFTISPFHTGSLYSGYRRSYEYGGPRGISLGTAVTISGAAASPNMGYHSSPTMAFLLTMFNVRLGAWLGNTGLPGQTAYTKAHPSTNLRPLLSELTGGSTDQSKWVYLSDGGHFENLGIYEMILRRCHYIVVSDAGADPKFSFEDLGNAMRKIRTDLGVPIDLGSKITMRPRDEKGKFGKGSFATVAKIRYSVVDKDGKDGTLIYIKAGIYADDHLPRDVYNYAQESSLFPHEPTSDQFFSESQFESYRALGRHAVNSICGNYKPDPATGIDRIPIGKQFDSIREFTAVIP